MRHFIFLFLALNLLFLGKSQDLNCLKASNDASFLKGVWIGEFTQYSCGLNESYAMTVEIDEIDGNKFTGFFIWNDLPDTPNTKTTLSGELFGDSIVITENSLVSGGGVVLNGVYEVLIIDCYALKGKWRLDSLVDGCDDPQDLIDAGRYTISKLVTPEEKESKADVVKRAVIIKDQVKAKTDYVTIKLWDKGKFDGDTITLRLNGKIALYKFEVTKTPHEIIIPLTEKENIIELYAENVGTIPPNTAAIAIMSGGKEIKRLVLRSDLNKSEAIKIIKK